MKKRITLLSLLFLVATTIISCKKDTTSLKARMMGKWMISKIETTGYTAAETLNDPTKLNGTVTYGSTADYIDFKSNNDDQVELSLKGNRTIGTYTITYEDQFTMDLNDGLNYAAVNSITTTQFQFTSTINNRIKKVYYLTK
ncbi:lipocalin family protein [Pedobacter sp. BMA]|uniref:lipocalin family protein n=1 Tax=Pedobacter sp. BMA TaxID=1663685 RepID=UPI00064A98BB|nr:lipocalin family protein [Pedobacter sp. BMA]KLT66012.1 hypothetical protein AB669_07505 [Pedobacter sp. BMA]